MTFQPAVRVALPLLLSVAGTSGSGKTYSALLMAAGIAGPDGKVGFIDTELGRGSMYADDPEIVAAMPGGQYYIKNLTEPFTPAKYKDAIIEARDSGVSVLVIDSATHEWEGLGGCQDIAENNKLRNAPNWAKAKLEHKRLMNTATQCPMHIIFCLRAREKTKQTYNSNGKLEFVDEGMQPIQEKNFMYEMTVAMMLEESAPGKPIITKCPKPLRHLFTGDQALITQEVGQKLRAWADGGASVDTRLRDLKRECREAAMYGSDVLDSFFRRIDSTDKEMLKQLTDEIFQQEVRALAKEADTVNATQMEVDENPQKLFNDQ